MQLSIVLVLIAFEWSGRKGSHRLHDGDRLRDEPKKNSHKQQEPVAQRQKLSVFPDGSATEVDRQHGRGNRRSRSSIADEIIANHGLSQNLAVNQSTHVASPDTAHQQHTAQHH